MNTRQRCEAVRLQCFLVDDHHRRSAVTDLAGGRGGDAAVLGQQLDTRDRFERRIKANAFVDGMHFAGLGAIEASHFKRHDLVVERASLGAGDSSEEHTSELQSLMRTSYAVC